MTPTILYIKIKLIYRVLRVEIRIYLTSSVFIHKIKTQHHALSNILKRGATQRLSHGFEDPCVYHKRTKDLIIFIHVVCHYLKWQRYSKHIDLRTTY
jgi:hypothetical protein